MSDDIYALTGRMKNIIASDGISLSPAGTILLNTFALALKDLYDFSDTLPAESGQALKNLLATKEGLPCYVIKLTSPRPQATVGEQVEKAEIQFETLEKALEYYQKEYNALGEEYGISGDELWLRAENASMLDEDCLKIMRLNRSIQMCKYLIKKGPERAVENEIGDTSGADWLGESH